MYYGSNKSTGKETGKSHLCAVGQNNFVWNILWFTDEEDITERIAAPESGGMANGNIEIETVFGPKIRRRKKKMETRLLKEILSDFSFTKRKGKTDFHGSLF